MATQNLNLETIELTDNMKSSLLEKMNGNFEKIDAAFIALKNTLLEKTGKSTLAEAVAYVDQLVNAQDATATASKIFNGYTAYKGTEKIIGTALATASTGTASQLLNGQKLYNSSGALITGTMANKGGVQQDASSVINGDYYVLKIPVTGYYTTGSWLRRTKANVLNDLGVTPMPTINVTLTGNYTSYIADYGVGISNEGTLIIWVLSNSDTYENFKFEDVSIGAGVIGKGWNITDFDTSGTYFPHACTITGLADKTAISITLNANGVNATDDYIFVEVTLTAS